jgi:hypothetical protein
MQATATRPDLISDEPRIQAHYEQCLRNGCSPKLAEALAFQQGPALKTDALLFEGHHNGNQFQDSPSTGDFYKQAAQRAGVSTAGKIYLGTLANFPGDPRAWVSDRHDVQKVLEERGWGCSGAVSRKVDDLPSTESHPGVADDIVDDEVDRLTTKNPDLAPTPKEKLELKEKIKGERTPHWHKKKSSGA